MRAAEVCVARRPALIQTLLGSCVAAVLWSPRLRVGAVCHGALPKCPEQYIAANDVTGGLRYVDFAIRYLLQRMLALGVERDEIDVRLFGGADVLPALGDRQGATIGRQNCESAIATVKEEGLVLTHWDLGGEQGRVIYFRTDTGEVQIRRLPVSQFRA